MYSDDESTATKASPADANSTTPATLTKSRIGTMVATSTRDSTRFRPSSYWRRDDALLDHPIGEASRCYRRGMPPRSPARTTCTKILPPSFLSYPGRKTTEAAERWRLGICQPSHALLRCPYLCHGLRLLDISPQWTSGCSGTVNRSSGPMARTRAGCHYPAPTAAPLSSRDLPQHSMPWPRTGCAVIRPRFSRLCPSWEECENLDRSAGENPPWVELGSACTC